MSLIINPTISPFESLLMPFTKREKGILLLFSPFQGIINTHPSTIQWWLDCTKVFSPLGEVHHLEIEIVFKKMIRYGIAKPAHPSFSNHILMINPLFSYALKKGLNTEGVGFNNQLIKIYVQFYCNYAEVIHKKLFQDTESDGKDTAILWLEKLNIIHALQLAVKFGYEYIPIFATLFAGYFEENQIDECLRLSQSIFEEIIKCYDYDKKAVHDSQLLVIIESIARCYTAKRQLKEAQKYFLDALTIEKQANNFSQSSGDILLMLGNICRDLNDYGESNEYYQKAFSVFDRSKDKRGIALVYQNRGRYHYDLNDFITSESHFKSALKIYIQLKDVRAEGKIYQLLGGLYYRKAKFSKSKEYYQKTIAISEFLADNFMLAKAYQGLGILLSAQQQYEASLGYYKIALKNFILLATEYRYDIAQVYYNMGNDSYNLTLYEDAKIYYTQSLEAYTLLEDVLKKGEIYQNLGNVCYYLDDLEGSMSWDFEAIKLFVNFSMKKEIAEILFNALNLSLEMKDKTHYNKIWSYLEMSFSAEDLQDILRLTTLL